MITNNFFLKNKIILILFLFFIFAPLSLETSFAQDLTKTQTSYSDIQVEKRQYQTDDIVKISGSNFYSFERITIVIKYSDVYLKQDLLLDRFDVNADGSGQISASWQVLSVNDAGTTFIIEATGTLSGRTAVARFSTDPLAGESVSLAQCANSNATPQNLDCPPASPAGWVTGNAGSSKAKYFEGDTIAYRNVLHGLIVTKTYKWTVQYDTSKGGLNALDYLTTYNRTITNANPCQSGSDPIAFCSGAPSSTFMIPDDPMVLTGRNQIDEGGGGDDIDQIDGVVSAWGATITGVSVPTYSGTFPGGDSTASVEITFVADNATAVIAWGGHTSTRTDWGQTFGSVNIPGSPYHTNNGGLINITDSTSCCTGSQDLQLDAAAVTATARINIVKHASPPSPMAFGFTTTNLTPSNFTLTDSSITTDPTQVFDNINTFDLKTIDETSFAPYTLQSIICTIDIGAGGTPAPVRVGNSIQIDIKEGDQVTCTFNNDFVTAAAVSVSGQVFNPFGRGLSGARVSIIGTDGNIRTTITNPFGYFRFDEVEAGQTYVLNAVHKIYRFSPQVIDPDEDLTKLNFYPNHK